MVTVNLSMSKLFFIDINCFKLIFILLFLMLEDQGYILNYINKTNGRPRRGFIE